MPSLVMTLHLPASRETELLGAALAAALPRAPPLGAVLHLQGDLGAGKTTCVRGLLRALGEGGLVRSPTYTLLQTYATSSVTCVHVDLYRLADANEVESLGLRDLAEPATLIMIEWPEKGGVAVPRADVAVSLRYEGHARVAQLIAASQRGDAWLRNLGDDTRLTSYVSNIT